MNRQAALRRSAAGNATSNTFCRRFMGVRHLLRSMAQRGSMKLTVPPPA
jgi:hypothetical protein